MAEHTAICRGRVEAFWSIGMSPKVFCAGTGGSAASPQAFGHAPIAGPWLLWELGAMGTCVPAPLSWQVSGCGALGVEARQAGGVPVGVRVPA